MKETTDRISRHIRITQIVFIAGGVLIGVAGVVLTFGFKKSDLGNPNMVAGAILVGIGALAECLLNMYLHIKTIEAKLEELSKRTDRHDDK